MIFYGLVLLATSATGVLWRYLARRRDLLEPDVTDQEVDAMTALTTPSAAFHAIVVALAFISPPVAAFGYLTMAVVGVFRQRGDLTPSSA